MTTAIVDKVKVIDIDTHIAEPEDLWTSRVSRKWGDLIPHVTKAAERTEGSVSGAVLRSSAPGDDVWMVGDEATQGTAFLAWAGHHEYWPKHPRSLREADPATYDAKARLKLMDECGVYAAAIFPNFGLGGRFSQMAKNEPELAVECCRAYNDFLTEWCSVDPKRLIAQTMLPLWDVDLCVREIERCAKAGHRAVVFSHQTETLGLPYMPDSHWDPIYSCAQDLGLPICFHVGGARGNVMWPNYKPPTALLKVTVMSFLDNVNGIVDVIFSGLCHRFPQLNFISVESGVGYLPYLLEAMDWQWTNIAPETQVPGMDLLPSEYFRRQVYGSFWFEDSAAVQALPLLPDNILYETDYPHPTSISPGRFPFSKTARDDLNRKLAAVPEDVVRKVLQDNAARLYHLDV